MTATPSALVFGGAGLAGALSGAYLAKQIDGSQLLLWFAGAMALIALSMMLPRKNSGDPGVRLNAQLSLKLTPVGLAAGFAAGFFGIGGGFLIVPGLMAATGITLAHAAASSLVSVVVFGAATSASYAASGLIDWPIFGALVLGGAAGSLAGGPVALLLSGREAIARRIFATMVLATAAYVAFRAAG